VELRVSVIDMGQAIRTCMLQLAAESTGLDPRSFDMITGDTELTHPHRSASGQRQTLISGNAVVMAGKAFKEKLLDAVAGWSGIPVSDLAVAQGEVRTQWSQYRNEATVMTLAQAAAKARERMETISAEAEYVAPTTYPLSDVEAKKRVPRDQYRNYPTYSYATQVALVEVEEATGEVKVVRVIAAHDVGKIINPQQIRGQLVGSIVMMQGYTLTEDYPLKEGRPLQRHVTFGRLGLPLSTDIPTVRLEIVENPFPEGPFGAKGISEIATVPSPPAILNAIYDATRVRVRALPVNPDELKRGMNPS
jgi:CO/xanthine dehydrogenase Mo-binding subunit